MHRRTAGTEADRKALNLRMVRVPYAGVTAEISRQRAQDPYHGLSISAETAGSRQAPPFLPTQEGPQGKKFHRAESVRRFARLHGLNLVLALMLLKYPRETQSGSA